MRILVYIKKFWYLWAILILVFINLAGIFLFVSLFAKQADDFALVKKLKVPVDLVKRSLDVFYLPISLWSENELEQYKLVIDQKDYKKLIENIPPEGKTLTSEYKVEIPAKFYHNNIEYSVELRFRGELEDHWRNEKKSWRIQFPKDNYFEGLRELHLIIPVDRQYVVEEFNQYRARKLGLDIPESKFVTLEVNGQGPMVYWQVEGWTNDYLERQQKPADSNFYAADIKNIDLLDDYTIYTQAHALSTFKLVIRDETKEIDNFAEFNQWHELMTTDDDDFFYQRFANLVDLDSFYAWSAHGILAGSRHGEDGTNIRLFFNNSKGKFEFVPWNIEFQDTLTQGIDSNHDLYVSRILTNPEYIFERNKVLAGYVNDEHNLSRDLIKYDELWSETKASIYNDRNKIQSNLEVTDQVKESREKIIENWHKIQQVLEESRIISEIKLQTQDTKIVANVHLTSDSFSTALWRRLRVEFKPGVGGELELWSDINNNGLLDDEDIKIENLVYEEEKNRSQVDLAIKLYPGRRILPIPDNSLVPTPLYYDYLIINPSQSNFDIVDIDLKFKNAITGNKVEPIIRIIDNSIFKGMKHIHDDFVLIKERFPFLQLNGKDIKLLAGNHKLNETLVIPADYNLVISPGVELDVAEGVSILSLGQVTAVGTEEQPIVIRASNQEEPWGVLLSANTEKINSFKHVIMSGGSSDYLNGIFTRGMLSVFYGDVLIDNCEFYGAWSDDLVNVKNGHVEITNSFFHNTPFDAFDGDFISGVISDNKFINNGNDGIDLSGSQELMISNNLIRNNDDKGISIGEQSNPIIFNNIIVENNQGLASKDNSNPLIVNNNFYQNQTNIAVFMKKNVFGGSSGRIYNSIIWGAADSNIAVDQFSKISVRHSSVEGGYAGDGNQEIIPQLNKEYLASDGRFENRGDVDILRELGIEVESSPIGILSNFAY